jgi:formate hydrogenlyase subunit 4
VSTLFALLAQLLHVGLVLAAAPLLPGLDARLRARLAGRAGPPVLQPWRDLVRLARKQPVVAEGASFVFLAAPVGAFAASLAAATLVPSFALGMTAAPLADLLVIGGLLALAHAILALAAMDTGAAPGGIAASRDMLVLVFSAPALLLAAFALGLFAGTTNLDAIAAAVRDGAAPAAAPTPYVSLGLALLSLLAVATVARAGRGDSRPDYAGRHLALLQWEAALRRLAALGLIVAAFAPFGAADAGGSPLAWLGGALAWAGKLALLTVVLALLEAPRAPVRLARVPDALGLAVLLALLAVLFLFVSQGLT